MGCGGRGDRTADVWGLREVKQRTWLESPGFGGSREVLHGESNTGQASPRTPTQRTFQPQEAVQPQQNQTILQPDTPAQKAKYSYKWSHPTPHEADAHTSHVHKNAPSRAQSPGG